MKITLIFCLVIAGAPLAAQDAQFISLMKDMDTAFGVLRQSDFMSNKKAVRNAEKLGTGYEDLIEFWRQQNVDKAVTLSETGKAAAVQLADAVHSGNAEKAASLVKAVGDTCHSCHEAFREKLPDGQYRIKTEAPARKVPARTH